jgi:hypothetical protein
MPGAGFYAIHNSTIRFGRDGVWYADDRPIENSRIADLFSRHVRRRNDGTYVLEIGPERVPIEVEDTPYVVVGARFDERDGMTVELNDHTVEPLPTEGIEVGPDDVVYCRVKGGAERARFLRPVYYDIAKRIVEAEPGRFVLRAGEKDYPIRRA